MKISPQKFAELDRKYREGRTLYGQGHFLRAAKIFDFLIRAGARDADVFKLAAISHAGTDDAIAALKAVEQGLDLFPGDQDLLILQVKYLSLTGRVAEAVSVVDGVLEEDPHNQRFLMLYGEINANYANIDNFEKTCASMLQILQKDPENVEALVSLGTFLMHANQASKAAEYLIRALRLAPTNITAMINLAVSFHKMQEAQMALKFYDNVIGLNPDYGLAKCGKGSILCNHGLSEEYASMIKEGANMMLKEGRLKDYITYTSNYILFLHYIPHRERAEIFQEIRDIYPFAYGNLKERNRLSFKNIPDPERKLRVGMMSSCFRMHPVTWMTLAGIENLDRSRFELVAISDLDVTGKDLVTERYHGLCDRVVEVAGMTNEELLDVVRAENLDVVLEMTGHSEGGRRLPLVVQRVAPVQVKWVGGLFNTSGLPQMDWIIGDSIETPEGVDEFYSERIYRMPDDYVVYEPPTDVADVNALPALKNGYVTFATMNNLTKTNTYTISLWAKILKAVPKSRILMKTKSIDTQFARQHIEEQFATHGIGIDRLVFEGGGPHKNFMESYGRTDIALDPHPYTGGLSTCEALWMGVPVVTLPGDTFAGRHAATHLYHAGFADWIAKDEDEYVALAVKWANNLEGLAKLRAGMREQVRNSPLCDGPRFARNFENALRFMWKDWCGEKMKEGGVKPAVRAISPPKPKKKKKK